MAVRSNLKPPGTAVQFPPAQCRSLCPTCSTGPPQVPPVLAEARARPPFARGPPDSAGGGAGSAPGVQRAWALVSEHLGPPAAVPSSGGRNGPRRRPRCRASALGSRRGAAVRAHFPSLSRTWPEHPSEATRGPYLAGPPLPAHRKTCHRRVSEAILVPTGAAAGSQRQRPPRTLAQHSMELQSSNPWQNTVASLLSRSSILVSKSA